MAQFSPTGDWIAYTAITETNGSFEETLGLIRPDGSQKTIVDTGEFYAISGWLPDGQTLIYRATSGAVQPIPHKFYAVDVSSLERCLIASFPYPLKHWEDLYLADIDTCQPFQVTYSHPLEHATIWVGHSPQQPYMYVIVYEIPEGGDFAPGVALFVRNSATADSYSFQNEDLLFSDLAWSPDGSHFVLTAAYLDEYSADGSRIYLVDSATGVAQTLALQHGSAFSWSPDGHLLALQTEGSDDQSLYNLSTKEIIPLPTGFGDWFSPLKWSPREFYGPGACTGTR